MGKTTQMNQNKIQHQFPSPQFCCKGNVRTDVTSMASMEYLEVLPFGSTANLQHPCQLMLLATCGICG